MPEWTAQMGDLSLQDEAPGKATALGDVTNTPHRNFTSKDAEAHGWKKPEKYDYSRFVDKVDVPAHGNDATGDEVQAMTGAMYTSDAGEWASNAARYEWKDEYGDVAPRVPALEEKLFKDEHLLRKGDNFDALSLNVTQESVVQVRPIKSFEDAGLHPVMLENIKLCQYDKPTPIQAYCIPAILNNHDVIAIAQTGSGKTAAFLIPALSKLMGKAKKLAAPRPNPSEIFNVKLHGVRAEPLILVIAPTRELSVQIFDEARRLCYRSMLRPCVAYGGGPLREQIDELARGCDILIGTPGRLIDIMSRGHVLSFRRLRYTIIDEADELVGLDWKEDLDRIMSGGDNNEDGDHRYMLFSATFPKEARKLAREYLDVNHIRLSVGRLGSTHKNITQQIINCDDSNKRKCLVDLLMSLSPTKTMIFVNNKRAADYVDDFLFNTGLPSTSIHSDRTQREREDAIRAFRSSRAPILVTTGVASRGLDFSNVMHIVNYDLPNPDHGGITEYLHRIGRTARMGNVGVATSFFCERDEALAPMLVKVLMECEQTIPDFLEMYKPEEGAPLDFEDKSDDENDEAGAAGAAEGAWGGGGSGGDSGAWGAPATVGHDDSATGGNAGVERPPPGNDEW